MKAANNFDGSDISIPTKISEAYSKDVHVKKQLHMLPDLVTAYKNSQQVQVFKVTTLRTICDMLQAVPMA